MDMTSKTIAAALTVLALTAPSMALDRDHDERGTRIQDDRGARTLYLSRGGWDGNGPDMFGTVTEERGTRVMYRSGRGGWDANGPDAAGTQPEQTAEIKTDSLALEAVELPDGHLVRMKRD
ncbi:MAG TPA: hypothetical protein VH835_11535 [Dongiaceae bacterium]|jgi:hypothetical protein